MQGCRTSGCCASSWITGPAVVMTWIVHTPSQKLPQRSNGSGNGLCLRPRSWETPGGLWYGRVGPFWPRRPKRPGLVPDIEIASLPNFICVHSNFPMSCVQPGGYRVQPCAQRRSVGWGWDITAAGKQSKPGQRRCATHGLHPNDSMSLLGKCATRCWRETGAASRRIWAILMRRGFLLGAYKRKKQAAPCWITCPLAKGPQRIVWLPGCSYASVAAYVAHYMKIGRA